MKLKNETETGSIRRRFRKKRFAIIDSLVRGVTEARPGPCRILDIGGSSRYWQLLDPALRDRVTITVLNFQSELDFYAKTEDVGIDITEMIGDGCDMPQFDDGAFDIAHSNSVIEHVRSYDNMRRFAEETRRVGKSYYAQTPNYWFPIEPHLGVPFFHWLPDPMRIGLHHRFPIGFKSRMEYTDALRQIDSTRMVNKKLMRELFPEATIEHERFALMTKSLTAVYGPRA